LTTATPYDWEKTKNTHIFQKPSGKSMITDSGLPVAIDKNIGTYIGNIVTKYRKKISSI